MGGGGGGEGQLRESERGLSRWDVRWEGGKEGVKFERSKLHAQCAEELRY